MWSQEHRRKQKMAARRVKLDFLNLYPEKI